MSSEEPDELVKFRQLWIQEAEEVQQAKALSAMEYYNQGVELEKKNDFIAAVKSYRAALKLDPDIEKKYVLPASRIVASESIQKIANRKTSLLPEGEGREKELIVQKSIFLNKPIEIIVLVLQSCAITDLNSIFVLSQTCSLLASLIRHESLWSFVCERLQRYNLCDPAAYTEPSPWLNRFLHVPHLRIDGCYISKISYKRQGLSDLSVRLANLATVHVVTYYRYIRFLPQKKALLLITHKEPIEVVSKIFIGSKVEGLLYADYSWVSTQSILLQWSGKGKNNTEFVAHLKLNPLVQNSKIQWLDFSSKSQSQDEWVSFEKDQLKSFHFSRVRSY